jgi:hypothetical protein
MFSYCQISSFTPIQTTDEIMVLCILSCMYLDVKRMTKDFNVMVASNPPA